MDATARVRCALIASLPRPPPRRFYANLHQSQGDQIAKEQDADPANRPYCNLVIIPLRPGSNQEDTTKMRLTFYDLPVTADPAAALTRTKVAEYVRHRAKSDHWSRDVESYVIKEARALTRGRPGSPAPRGPWLAPTRLLSAEKSTPAAQPGLAPRARARALLTGSSPLLRRRRYRRGRGGRWWNSRASATTRPCSSRSRT